MRIQPVSQANFHLQQSQKLTREANYTQWAQDILNLAIANRVKRYIDEKAYSKALLPINKFDLDTSEREYKMYRAWRQGNA